MKDHDARERLGCICGCGVEVGFVDTLHDLCWVVADVAVGTVVLVAAVEELLECAREQKGRIACLACRMQ